MKEKKYSKTKSNKPKSDKGKSGLHERNPHRFRYNFAELIEAAPELGPFVSLNRYGNESVNFADPEAVKMLNRAILKKFYGITYWEIPEGYLCPPIPGRADYIHNLADLLSRVNGGTVPEGEKVSVLDIGVGANCIYPIIGSQAYGWSYTGTDIDPVSVKSSQEIAERNSSLNGLIEIKLQKKANNFFRGVMGDEKYDLTMCNPPFHSSLENAAAGTMRKRENMKLSKTETPVLNFGGQANELCCRGGEESFVSSMVKESQFFAEQCLWFTSLVSKKNILTGLYKTLRKVKANEVKTINMAQGNKVSRIIAWTFLDKDEREKWKEVRWKQ